MADPVPSSIQNTAIVGVSTTGGLVIAEYLVQPSWPPPIPVLTIAVGLLTPLIHLVARGIYRRILKWSGENSVQTVAQEPQKP